MCKRNVLKSLECRPLSDMISFFSLSGSTTNAITGFYICNINDLQAILYTKRIEIMEAKIEFTI